ncbi:MAG TPA: hypothetical protein VL132_04005 [Planctomycetaceae bacterium]|nr:hypothetical protein [Planctomycetaceae bacterium]
MAMDVYAPCPCGSGKKLKFCCADLAEDMDRITRLMENNQPRAALQQLEALAKRHARSSWVESTRILVHLELAEPAAARDLAREFLEHQPDHEFTLVLYATSALQADGYDQAEKLVHRAFQRASRKFPSMVAGLALASAAVMSSRGKFMSAREHLGFALKIAPDQDRQEIFVRLLEFDNSAQIPYPLRGAHNLPQAALSEPQQSEFKKALKYVSVGCWREAADVLQPLTVAVPESAEVHHAVGLCRAWSGDEAAAAAALHAAAGRYSDLATAVECETIAQLLDQNVATDRTDVLSLMFPLNSVSRLLTALDAVPRLQRLTLPPGDPDAPTASYQVLDRPRIRREDMAGLTVETAPQVVAQILVFDAERGVQEVPARMLIVAAAGKDFDDAGDLMRAVVGELADWSQPETSTVSSAARELHELGWSWGFPANASAVERQRIDLEQWARTVRDVWPNRKTFLLGGRSPRECVGDASSRVALYAAAYAFDAYCDEAGYNLDLDAVLKDLQLEPLPPLEVDGDAPVSNLSVMQTERLPVETLTDAQLMSVANRTLLIHHDRSVLRVLPLALERPNCLKQLDLDRCYMTLADLCRQHGRRDQALDWIQRGRTQISETDSSFEVQARWDFRELILRLEDPSDPGLRPLLNKFATYYSPKLPQLRPQLEGILAQLEVESPWSAGGLVMPGDRPAPGGVWQPGSPVAAGAESSGGKLWLPGQ